MRNSPYDEDQDFLYQDKDEAQGIIPGLTTSIEGLKQMMKPLRPKGQEASFEDSSSQSNSLFEANQRCTLGIANLDENLIEAGSLNKSKKLNTGSMKLVRNERQKI